MSDTLNTIALLPVYNSEIDMHRCIISVMEHTNLPMIVLNDGSPNPIVKAVLDSLVEQYSRRITAYHEDNRGIHGAWNRLMELAMAENPDWVLLLGSDAEIIQPNVMQLWHEGVARIEREHDCKLGACHAALYVSQEIVQWCGSTDGAIERERGTTSIGGHLRAGQVLVTGLTPWVTHTAVMLNCMALADVEAHYGEYYDERYEVYCGDRDMSYRLRSLGWECGMAAKVQVMHHHGGGGSVRNRYKDDREFWLKHDQALMHQLWDDVMNDESIIVLPPINEGVSVNLGCGRDYRDGWINIDTGDYKVDMKEDITSPRLLASLGGKCLFVLASHVLEHFEQFDNLRLLDIWLGLLMIGGKLEIIVPDFRWIAKKWAEFPDAELDNRFNHDQIFGLVSSGESELERHRQAFSEGRLRRFIHEAIADKDRAYELTGIEYGFDHDQQTMKATILRLR